MIEYAGIALFLLLATGLACLFLILTTVLGPKKANAVKSEPFECGLEPITPPKSRHSVKFYIIGMLFILFDVELVFLFPWAVLYRELGVLGFLEMSLFLLILLVGFVYAWKKGALELQ
jgi:NADH-quinone oxidoreductase subunit A